jgi:eukaryotic-like serine/threonine-protein kinase
VALTRSTRLGVDDISAQIGVGGMGEVCRATDSNLKRSVAIKVVPASVAGDADRVAFSANPRSSRPSTIRTSERLPAQEDTGLDGAPDGTGLEGEDLSQRIAPGAISVDALPIAKQIAEAPEAAPVVPKREGLPFGSRGSALVG